MLSKKAAVMVLFWVLLINVGLAARTETAFACSCAVQPSPDLIVKEELDHKYTVLAGKATKVKQPSQKIIMSSADQVQVTFEVSQVWKGDIGRKAVVYKAMSSESCGYENFQVGTSISCPLTKLQSA